MRKIMIYIIIVIFLVIILFVVIFNIFLVIILFVVIFVIFDIKYIKFEGGQCGCIDQHNDNCKYITENILQKIYYRKYITENIDSKEIIAGISCNIIIMLLSFFSFFVSGQNNDN